MPRSRHLLAALLLALMPVAVGGCQARAAAARAPEFWAFTGPWDAASDASVRRFGAQLDAVVTGWIALDSATALPITPSLYQDTVGGATRTFTRMALVTSWHGERFHASTIRRLGADRALLARAAAGITRQAAAGNYGGLVLDFETLEPADLTAQLAVVKAIRDSAHARGIRPVSVAIPALDTAGYPARRLLEVADYLVIMLYDQHWTGSEPGPIAAPDWAERALALRIREAGPDRLVAGFPTYGYRWREGQPTEILGYADARRIVAREQAALARDPESAWLRAQRPGAWDLWVSDAPLVERLVRSARAQGVHRFAFWRLGQEDPALWTSLLAPGRRVGR